MYRYQPLPQIADVGTTPPYTRILSLEPGKGDEPLCGRLDIINVESAPPYDALSYTWGTGDPTNYIWIEGEPIPLRSNLEIALRALRLPSNPRLMWIDALCIDQSSLDERSRQVQYMRLVYKHSEKVISWLGRKTPGVEEAFECAKRHSDVRRLVEESSEETDNQNQGQFYEFVHDMVGNATADLPETAMPHLYELFDREYFSRSWVVQEVFVGPPPVAKCEELEIPLFDLVSVLMFLGEQRKAIAKPSSLDVWYLISSARNPYSPVRTSQIPGSIGPLLSTLESMRHFKATDNRDKIYALLGICDEGTQATSATTRLTPTIDRFPSPLHSAATANPDFANSLSLELNVGIPGALKPDYNKDIVSVYTEIALYHIRKPPIALDILSYVQHHSNPSDNEYPSWVPKWFEKKAYQVFQGTPFAAGICSAPGFETFQQPRMHYSLSHPHRLGLEGFQVGVVHRVSNIIEFGRSAEDKTRVIQETFKQLLQFPMVPRPTRPYCSGGPLDVAFCKAISAGPLGSLYGSTLADMAMGFRLQHPGDLSRERWENASHRGVTAFLSKLAYEQGYPAAYDVPLSQADGGRDAVCFRNGFSMYSHHRRAFLTWDGHIGIGPTVMQPGDEVVVLFRGRMPYILRRRPDHYVFIGECYVQDDNIMYGGATQSVRYGIGGTPMFIYELR